jgi:hypothetical protein
MSLRKPSEPRKRLPSYIEHGSLTAYTSYECRCDDCREGIRLYNARRREAARRLSQAKARRRVVG